MVASVFRLFILPFFLNIFFFSLSLSFSACIHMCVCVLFEGFHGGAGCE